MIPNILHALMRLYALPALQEMQEMTTGSSELFKSSAAAFSSHVHEVRLIYQHHRHHDSFRVSRLLMLPHAQLLADVKGAMQADMQVARRDYVEQVSIHFLVLCDTYLC